MGPIGTFSGLASGIQWRDMIDQIIQLERVRRVNPLTNQISAQQKRIDAWNGYQGAVNKLATAAKALSKGTAFEAMRVTAGATPGGRALFSASASSAAQPGTYSVDVLQLAQAEKLGSGAQPSATASLELTGRQDPEGNPLALEFTVNGVPVAIAPDASLNDVRDAINAANQGATRSGVSATILSTGPNEHRLILTAEQTGADGIRLIDGEDGALGQLGIAQPTTQTAQFASKSTPIATILGLSSPPAVRTVVIGGQEITVDLETDTLDSILYKLQTASPAIGATIVTETVGGREVHRLQIDANVGPALDGEGNPDPVSQQILDELGLRATPASPINAGADARIAIDGFELTRRSNVIGDALAGVTLNLQHAEPGTAVDLRIERNQDSAVNAVKAFASAYNELVALTRQQSAAGQPLAGNGTLRTATSSLRNVLLTPPESSNGERHGFERATLIGVSLTRHGTLEVDEAALKQALSENPAGVRALFEGTGDGEDRIPGIAELMDRAAGEITRSGDGLIANQIASLKWSNESLGRRVDDVESRLELRYDSLVRQYARMEEALSTIQAQSNWLYSQVQALEPLRQRR